MRVRAKGDGEGPNTPLPFLLKLPCVAAFDLHILLTGIASQDLTREAMVLVKQEDVEVSGRCRGWRRGVSSKRAGERSYRQVQRCEGRLAWHPDR